jgi:hypothetical protein
MFVNTKNNALAWLVAHDLNVAYQLGDPASGEKHPVHKVPSSEFFAGHREATRDEIDGLAAPRLRGHANIPTPKPATPKPKAAAPARKRRGTARKAAPAATTPPAADKPPAAAAAVAGGEGATRSTTTTPPAAPKPSVRVEPLT